MAYIRRKTRTKPKISFYILIAAIAVAVFLVVFFLIYSPTVTAEEGEILFETQQSGVVARDEEVITKESYGKVTYIASEGEYVPEGAEIAEIYKAGYNDKIMAELLDVQTKIGQYQETVLLGDVLDQNLITLNTSIEQKADEISAAVTGETDSNLIQLEKELRRLLEDKQEYLRDVVKADAQLEEYYSKEAELKERVEDWKELVVSDKTGIVSFYFDGCEDLLNAKNLQSLTIKDINEILNGTSIAQLSNTDVKRPLYRIVNSYKWYLIVMSNSAVKEFENGKEFSVSFDEYLDKEYSGKIIGVREEDSGYVYMIEFNDDIGPLISTRRTFADIHCIYSGIKLPKSCIKVQNGINGVYRQIDDMSVFIPVNILMEQDNECIVEAVDSDRPIEVGDVIKL